MTLVRKIFKGGGIIFAGRILELGIAFAGAAIIARLIGPSDFGAISLGATLLTTAASLVLAGLHTGVGRYLPRHDSESESRGIIISALQMVVPASLVASLGLVLFAGEISRLAFGDPSLTLILRIFGAAVPFAALVQLLIGVTQGQQLTIPKVVMKNLAVPVVRVSSAVLVILLGFGTVAISFAYGFAYVVAAIIGVYYLVKTTPILSDVSYEPKRRELLVFSAPLAASIIIEQVLRNIDTFLIGYYTTTDAVGIYNVAYPLAQLILLVLTSMEFIFMPILSELHSDGRHDEMQRFYQIVTKWSFTGTLPVFFVLVLFPRLTISLTFGDQYTSGAQALAVLSLGFFIHVLSGPNNTTLTSTGRTKFVMYVNLLAGVLNLLLNIWLISELSFLGAAIATTVSYGLMNLFFAGYLYSRMGIHPLSSALVRPGVAAAVLLLIVRWAVRTFFGVSVVSLVLAFTAFCGLYAVAVLRFGGIEQEEIQLLLDFEHKFDVDLTPLKNVAKRLL
jgi:O-antigen/teichoic acid export membrane protein